MLNQLNVCRLLNKKLARFALMFLLAGVLAAASADFTGHLPSLSGTAEAGCFTLANSQCDVLKTISICDIGNGDFKVQFTLANGADGGSAFSSCGLGNAAFTGVTPGGTGTDNCIPGDYDFIVHPTSLPATVSYRVQAYVAGQPKKWVGSYTFNGSGGCVSNQSCPF